MPVAMPVGMLLVTVGMPAAVCLLCRLVGGERLRVVRQHGLQRGERGGGRVAAVAAVAAVSPLAPPLAEEVDAEALLLLPLLGLVHRIAVGGERFLRGKASVCGYDVGKRLLQRAVHAAHVWGAGNGGLRRGRFVHRKRLGPSAKGSAATVGRLHLRLGVKRGAFCLNPMRPIRVNDWNEKGWALLGRLSFPLTGWMRHFSYSVYVTRL